VSAGRVSDNLEGLSATNDTRLKDLKFATPLEFENHQISFKINGETFTFSDTDTLSKMMSTVNSNQNAGVVMSYSRLTDKFTVESKATGAGEKLTIDNLRGNAFSEGGAFGMNMVKSKYSDAVISDDGTYLSEEHLSATLGGFRPAGDHNSLFEDGEDTLSFEINGKRFEFDKNQTVQDMIDAVNDPANGAGVKVEFVQALRAFKITAADGGMLDIKNISGYVFGENSAIGIKDIENTYNDGRNAKLKINGVDVERATNSFTIDGISYSLNRTTDSPVNAAVTRDVASAVEKIKAFVEAYNKLVKGLDDKISESKTAKEREYTPRTDAEKAEMTEKEIEAWDAVAKKGLLRADSGIQSMLNSLRSALYERVEQAGLSPSDLGLKTAEYSAGTKGQIVLDEAKLTAALEADPERVMSVFTSTPPDGATASAPLS
jgi:flagellar hook-associated protein 2